MRYYRVSEKIKFYTYKFCFICMFFLLLSYPLSHPNPLCHIPSLTQCLSQTSPLSHILTLSYPFPLQILFSQIPFFTHSLFVTFPLSQALSLFISLYFLCFYLKGRKIYFCLVILIVKCYTYLLKNSLN